MLQILVLQVNLGSVPEGIEFGRILGTCLIEHVLYSNRRQFYSAKYRFRNLGLYTVR